MPVHTRTRTLQNQYPGGPEAATIAPDQIKVPVSVFLLPRQDFAAQYLLTLYQMLPVILGVATHHSRDIKSSELCEGFVGDPSHGTMLKCSEAQTFVLGNCRLQSAGRPLSANPGVRYVDLTSHPEGTIDSCFENVNGFLEWRNPAFYGGAAKFCQVANGHIYATFTESGGPASCTPVYLPVYAGMSLNSAS